MIFLILLKITFQQVFQKNYITDKVTFNYTLSNTSNYTIQMSILEFPSSPNYLPTMQIKYNNKTYTDDQNIQLRNNLQKVVVQNCSLIQINISSLPVINMISSNLNMSFQITIFENQTDSSICYFPSYGTNCQNKLNLLNTSVEYALQVITGIWYLAYINLTQSSYNLKIQTSAEMIGLSIIPLDTPNITSLPSFKQLFQTIQSNQKLEITLENIKKIDGYVVVFGLYNFDSPTSIQLSIVPINTSSAIPEWLYGVIGTIVFIGVVAAFVICCQIQRQSRQITQEKPALELEILNKYLPAHKINRFQINDHCSVCLVNFEQRSQVRYTPCKHVFHDQCLMDWTKKQANCPNCRAGLSEDDLIKNQQLQSEASQIHLKKQLDNLTSNNIRLSQFGTQHQINLMAGRTSHDTEYSPSNMRSADRLSSINIIHREDAIIED
ncbi:hypothetical protein pb186bvf_000791 [Paramecium bursaria]